MDFPHRARLCGAALLLLTVGACSGSSGGGSGTGGNAAGTGGATTGTGGMSPGTGGNSTGTGGTVGTGGVVGTGGSSGMDAGTGGSGTGGVTDGGGGDGTSAGCPYMFCEDFEKDTVGMPPNPAIWHQDGTPTIVDAVKPHLGKNALHVLPHVGALCTDGQPCIAARFARLTDAFPAALHKQGYGRLFFYMNQTPTDSAYYHWMVMEVNASTTYSGGLALRQGGEINGPNSPGKDILLTHIDTHNKMDNPFETERGRVQTQTPIMNKTWYCLEWFIDATAQKARYWLNGMARDGLNFDGPVAGSPQFNLPAEFKSLAVGMRVFQVSTQNFELFVDDVALDSKQIGCN